MDACFKAKISVAGVAMALIFHVMPTAAAEPNAPSGFGTPVSDARLTTLRGGFSFGNAGQGFEVAFAIQQVSYVNGELVAQTKLNLPDGVSLSNLSSLVAPTQVIQVGPGNSFAPPPGDLAPAALTVLQNSLDGQTIANATIIDATVTARKFLSGLMLSNTLGDALSRARY